MFNKIMFWVVAFLVSISLVADLESGFGTWHHAVAVLGGALLLLTIIAIGAGYCALVYMVLTEDWRIARMSKEEKEREYLGRVSGIIK